MNPASVADAAKDGNLAQVRGQSRKNASVNAARAR